MLAAHRLSRSGDGHLGADLLELLLGVLGLVLAHGLLELLGQALDEVLGLLELLGQAEERAVEAMARGFLGAPRSLLARRWTAEKDGHRGRSSLQLCGFRLTWHHFSLHQPIALHGQDVIWHSYATAKAYASPLLNIQPKLSVCHHSPASRENFCVLYC